MADFFTNNGVNFYVESGFNALVKIGQVDDSGLITIGSFTGATPSETNRYQKGCIMVKTDAADGVKAIYENTGTVAIPSFDLVGQITSGDIGNGAVTLVKLATGVAPSHVVKFAGNHTTTGGSATEAFTVTGVAATDLVFVTMKTQGVTPETILSAAPTTNTITVVFSGDPSTDHVVAYQVLRLAV